MCNESECSQTTKPLLVRMHYNNSGPGRFGQVLGPCSCLQQHTGSGRSYKTIAAVWTAFVVKTRALPDLVACGSAAPMGFLGWIRLVVTV